MSESNSIPSPFQKTKEIIVHTSNQELIEKAVIEFVKFSETMNKLGMKPTQFTDRDFCAGFMTGLKLLGIPNALQISSDLAVVIKGLMNNQCNCDNCRKK